jgi:hypothetical protein
MTESGKIPAINEIWSHFDLGGLTKLVSVLAAFAYATGVIAINTYLHGLGIVDFSFAKPKLLLTGILVLTSFLLLAVPPFFYAWSIASKRGQTGQSRLSLKRILVLVFSFIGVLLLIAVPLHAKDHPGMGQMTVWEVWKCVKPYSGLVRSLTALIVTVEVYLPIFFAAVSVYAATRLFDQDGSEQPTVPISLRWFGLAFATAGFAVSTIGYIYIFTRTFYSVIPQEFGGGKPYYQSFAIAKEDLCQLQQLGIPFAQGNITESLPVLHETDTLVAVWLDAAPSSNRSPEGWNFVVAELDNKQINATKVDDEPQDPVPPHLSPLPPQLCKD